MQKTEIITCINCPVGCRMEVTLEDGAVISVKGNTCKRGDTYAHQECVQPLRMITAVAPVEGSIMPVSCKTRTPIPKERSKIACAPSMICASMPPSRLAMC